MIRLTYDPIDYARLTADVFRPECGGVVVFLGTVREFTGQIRTVCLDYHAYPPMAEKVLAAIEAEVRARWPVGDVAMVHRLGRLAVTDVSVAVAVSCPHRAEAFEACRYAIDRLKDLVPIWKHDTAPDGSAGWVHPDSPATPTPELADGPRRVEPAESLSRPSRRDGMDQDRPTHGPN